MTQLFSTGEVAHLLSIPQHKLLYAIEQQATSDSSLRVGGKRIFTEDDVRRLATHFQIEVEGSQNCKEQGGVK